MSLSGGQKFLFTALAAVFVALTAALVAFVYWHNSGGMHAAGQGHGHSGHQTLEAAESGLAGDSLYQLESVWVDERGETGQLRRFAGKPAVLAMIYTSCEYACPLIIGDMMKIYNALSLSERSQTRFVLVSFDPQRDTPTVMRGYKEKNLPAEDWTLITADDGDTLEFSVALGVRYKPVGSGDFSHSNLVVVLDDEGREIFRQDGLGNPPDQALAVLRGLGVGA